MKKRGPKVEPKRAYVVTEDLSLLVRRWCSQQGLKISPAMLPESFFQNIFNKLIECLRKYCFSEQEIEVMPLQLNTFDDLLRKHDAIPVLDELLHKSAEIPALGTALRRLDTLLHKHTEVPTLKEFWVSLDDVYPKPLEQSESKYNMSVTRYVSTSYEKLGHGPRPENNEKSLKSQVRECVNIWEKTKKLPIVLVDDGTFDGDTVEEVLNEFARQEVFINSVRLGVAKRVGIEKIANWSFDEEMQGGKTRTHKVNFIGASKLCPPIYDWICERDFFPGVLYAGKVIARREGNEIKPLLVGKQNIPVRAQYLYDWGEVWKWASIEEGKSRPFTAEVLKLSIELWEKLEKLRGRTIFIKDLPAIPLKIYSSNRAFMQKQLERSWLEVLKNKQKQIERAL